MKKEIEQKLIRNRREILESEELSAVVAVEGAMKQGIWQYFMKHHFVDVNVPHLTRVSGACENVQTLFDVEFFGRDSYLSQTGQLYLEAFIPRHKKLGCIGPSFRKEDVVDSRHLVEFPLIEIEHEGDIDVLKGHIEGLIGAMVLNAWEKCGNELGFLGVNVDELRKIMPPFMSMTYTEAVDLLSKEYGVKWGDDLKSKHEAKLVEMNDGKPLYVTHYPANIKFFNMRVNRENSDVVNSGDLLLPYGGEAVGSAEREEDYGILEKRLIESTMVKVFKTVLRGKSEYELFSDRELSDEVISRFSWYLDLIKKNPIMHAGCGIGMNRVTQAILQCSDIRAATSYPMNKEMIL